MIGPRPPLPTVIRSTERIGVTSAAVPVKKARLPRKARRAEWCALYGDAEFLANLDDAVARDARKN